MLSPLPDPGGLPLQRLASLPDRPHDRVGIMWPSLLVILLLVAVVALLFTGRYPIGLYNLVIGVNRWALRVRAYTTLMRDEYPPLRLDMGPREQVSQPATAASDYSAGVPSHRKRRVCALALE